jgi:hypothetical protein
MDHIFYGETRLYPGVLIRCQTYHGDYVCSYSIVAMLCGDGTTFSTQVPTIRCVWVPAVVSCHVEH